MTTIDALDHGTAVVDAIAEIRTALAPYVFRATSEASLKDQVTLALASSHPDWSIRSEVRARAGRYDLLVTVPRTGLDGQAFTRVVIEIKLRAAAASVERQAQRYAQMPDVDAVVVVTTSRRLAAQLVSSGGPSLCGKPFEAIAVRTS